MTNGRTHSAQLPPETYQQLRALAFKTGVTMTEILRRLVALEHARVERRAKERLA